MVARHLGAVLVGSLLLLSATASADVALSVRAGATELELGSAEKMPIVGDQLDGAVTTYNQAAAAYNQAHGYAVGSAEAAPMASLADLGLAARLVAVTPSLDVSAGPLRARVEVPIGYGEGMRTIGVGVYPIGLAFAPARSVAVPFVLAGGAISHMSRGDLEGALIEARVVGGVRFANRVSLEIGYRPYVTGGVADRSRLSTMASGYDPMGTEAPTLPTSVVRGGVGQAFDVTLGVSL